MVFRFMADLLADVSIVGLLSTLIVSVLIWYSIRRWSRSRSRRSQKTGPQLTPEEEDAIISAWTPEPLVPECDQNHYALNPRIVSSKYGKRVVVDGKECLNLATHNYLGLAEDPDCLQEAVEAVKVYGVGSCGPRGFFGTVDIHLKLEEEIAKFFQTEEAILYSYGYAAISSAIPAYSKANDIIFVDEEVNFAIQQGLTASRSKIKYFRHNDMADLERLLEEQHRLDLANPKKAKSMSRFMVVEGLYINTGNICPLQEIIRLKRKHKVRLFIDDTCGFGVLGEHGRGTVEHLGCNLDDVDMIAASLEYACASYGGFCTGTSFVIDHQRLSGQGYCFSASLPPLQAAYAYRAIKKIEQQPEMLRTLRENCLIMDKLLAKHRDLIDTTGLDISPIKHLRFVQPIEQWLKERTGRTDAMEAHRLDTLRLENVVKYAYEKGYVLTVARYLERVEHKLQKPSIRLIVSAVLSPKDLEQTTEMLTDAFKHVERKWLTGDL